MCTDCRVLNRALSEKMLKVFSISLNLALYRKYVKFRLKLLIPNVNFIDCQPYIFWFSIEKRFDASESEAESGEEEILDGSKNL